ncbi:MAG: hypothetical protein ACXW5U_25140 [Thermoanaerobaculia bacterium]
MSVKIEIGSGGSFPDTTVNQSDLVFWFNNDKQTHDPIPRCEGLEVQPGQTTPPYQPIPQPAFPITIDYACALHPQESGKLTVNDDPTSPPQPDGVLSLGTKTIDIGPGGAFAPVDVLQSDNVSWKNNDRQAHWPVPNCSGLRVKPQAVSNGAQFFPPPLAAPLPISYGCAIAGHEAEQGTINVYGSWIVAAQPIAVSSATPYASAALVTGGKSPYTIVQDPNHPYLTAFETTPAGSSAGLSVILNSASPSKTTITYQVNATDALGNTINQPVQITIT